MFYKILVLKTQERDPIAAAGLIPALVDTFGDAEFGNVLFFVRNGNSQVAEYVVMLPPRAVRTQNQETTYVDVPVSEVESVVKRFYPQAIVEATYSTNTPIVGSYERWFRFIRPKNPFGIFNPTLPVDRIHRDDPFALLAQLIAQTPPDDFVYYGVQVLSARQSDFVMGAGKSIFWKTFGNLFSQNPYQQHGWNNRVDNIREAQQYKATEGAYLVIPYVCYRSPDKNRLKVAESVARIVTHCGLDAVPFAADFVFTDRVVKSEEDNTEPMWFFVFNDMEERHRGTRYKHEDDMYLLTPRELAALWHLPDKSYPQDAISWVEEAVCREIPDELKSVANGILLGINEGCDRNRTVYNVRLPYQRDIWHKLILGKTGTGKTSLMHQMIHEEIAAGKSVVVIDPKGSHPDGLITRILEQSIEASRIDDVVFVDLTAIEDNPPPINPLLGIRGDNIRFTNASRNRITGDFVSTLVRLYGETDFVGTRMEDWLRLALKTIAIDENATLSDVRRVLRNKQYRNALIERSDQLPLLEDWHDFDVADRAEGTINGVITRIRRFIQSNETLSIVCHPKPMHYGELASQGKIILVSSGGRPCALSDKERLTFASVIVSQIMDGALSGLYTQPVSLYVDEVGQYINAPIPSMLRLVRSGNLAMTITSQGMSALSQEMQHAIDETVATIIGFAMSEPDAKMLKPYVGDVYTPDELQTLPQFTAAIATRFNGKYLSAFELQMKRLTPPSDAAQRAQAIRAHAIEKYMPMRYGEVIEAYKARYASNTLSPIEAEPEQDDFIKRPAKA